MAKAKDVLGSVIGMVAGKAGEGSGVDLVGAIVEAVKRLASDNEFIKQAVAALRAAGVRIPEEKPKAEAVAESEAAADLGRTDEEPVAPTAAEPTLSWCYGGFNGSNAAVVEDAVLRGVTLKGDTFTIEWDKGDCRNLGATSKEDSDHTVACLFLANGKGGKFEWISTSRKTRSTENIKNGYNKWPKSALDKGGRLWFCIAGVKDDKKTSNGKRTALVEVERK
jgi:hypothetical protein